MYKKLIGLTLILCVIILQVLNVCALDDNTVTLSITQAMDFAVKNNNTLKLLDEKIDLAKRRYNYALAMAKDAPEKYWGTDVQHIANKKEEILYPLQRKATLDDLIWQRQNSEVNLQLEVTKQYYQILQKQETISNQKNIIKRNKEEYDTKKKQYKLGNITESALLSYEITVNNAEITLQSLQNELESMIISFNGLLGEPLDTNVVLEQTELPAVELKVDSIDNLADTVAATSHDVQKLISDQLLKKTENDILHQYSIFKLPDECETLEDDILNLDYDIKNAKSDVELKVRTDYNNLLNLGDDVTINKYNYDYKNKLYEIAKKKYDFGLITYIDYINAEGEKDTAMVDYNTVKLTYYIAFEQFKSYVSPATIE